MDGATEENGVILATGDLDGAIQDGVTQATGDLDTDTTTTLIIMEEEVLHLITETEVMLTTETTPQTEDITLTEITPQIETTLQTEVVTRQIDKTDFLTLEEALQQTDEHTTLPAQILQTEEAHLKVTASTILTDDPVTQQPEATTAATHPETTLLVHHAP